MSHLHPDDRVQRRRKTECRKGRHLYGESQHIGAGILRRVCQACGTVTIDLTRAEEQGTTLTHTQARMMAMRSSRTKAP